MAFLSKGRFSDDPTGTYCEVVSFFGDTLEEADTEMRQWLMHTMLLGSCVMTIQTRYMPRMGGMHHISLLYTCQQQIEDRVEPKGLLGSTDLS